MEIDMNQTSKMPVSDDPELAKILSGVGGSSDDSDDNKNTDELQYEDLNQVEVPVTEEDQLVTEQPQQTAMSSFGGLDLDTIKGYALEALRPLVDKLTVSNEEKFDIYLLLLRSSDDNTLIEPAYNAARMIEDETKRANALLDVSKEIDYFMCK